MPDFDVVHPKPRSKGGDVAVPCGYDDDYEWVPNPEFSLRIPEDGLKQASVGSKQIVTVKAYVVGAELNKSSTGDSKKVVAEIRLDPISVSLAAVDKETDFSDMVED